MNYLLSFLEKRSVAVLVTGEVLAVLLVTFFVFFLAPSLWHWFRLWCIQRRIAAIGTNQEAVWDEFRKVFSGDKRLAHLWKKYEKSLHFEKEQHDALMIKNSARATVPAKIFFNSQLIVDSRLCAEFFKHLPGIFTGVGIIGTFSGLIEDLRAFRISPSCYLHLSRSLILRLRPWVAALKPLCATHLPR
jgi:hypothetical protein